MDIIKACEAFVLGSSPGSDANFKCHVRSMDRIAVFETANEGSIPSRGARLNATMVKGISQEPSKLLFQVRVLVVVPKTIGI